MSRFYFYNKDDTMCHLKTSIIDMIKFDELTERDVFEAKIIYGEDFMWCREFGEAGDKGNCGRSCEHYKPRNKISGNCIHTGYLYECDKKVLIKV